MTRVDVGAGGDVTFNFVNADVRDVAREILGNQMHVTYTVDAKAQAAITAQSGSPVPHDKVLSVLETVLRASGLDLVEANGVYRILASDDAAKSSLMAAPSADQPGYGVRVFPLHHVSAAELKSVLQPFLPPGSAIEADAARNLLIVSSPGGRDGLGGLIRQFDVDWLAGTSFGLYPLKVGTARDIANELDEIFGENGKAALAGLVRIVPIPRLNAILVITSQRGYLAQVKAWIDRLDYGDDEVTPRLFEYKVQNSRASDLAAVLTRLLSSGAVSTVRPEVASGSQAAVAMQQQATGAMTAQPGSAGGYGGGYGAVQSGPLGGYPGQAGAAPGGPAFAGSPGQAPLASSAQAAVAGRGEPLASAASLLNTPGPTGAGAISPENALQPPQARVVADEKNNALVIFARPRDYKMIEDVIRRLDVVPLQVMLEATIAEVTLNDALNYGLQFFLKPADKHSLEFTTNGKGTGVPQDLLPVVPGFNYVLNAGSARLVLSALSDITHVNVVSSPQLLVLDHQTAALQVGDQIPILTQSAVSVVTTGAPVVNSIEYRSTGVVLLITPRVNSSGLITLDIDQEVSNVKTTTSSTIDSPTITQRRIVSSVVVQDGQTVALGGLIQDSDTKSRQGIPGLEDIPILGLLFSDTTNQRARTELLVLISPKIIRNGQDALDMTEDLRNRMRTLKPLEVRIH
ncbi:MAG: type II secretion system secretin GspD [Alphaproteobacteria bacterium]|nr:type II secretion system secretin GspD [Alphaproteobacteria bacterium]